VGHSLGGIVVQHALARMTASAAVLMSSLPPSGLTTSMFHMGQHAPEVLWQFALLQLMGPTAVSPLIFRKALLTDATPVEMVIDMMQRMQQESHRVGLDLLMPPRLPTKSGLTPPMLVMGGDADIFVPVSALQETASHFGASINILAGAPHGLMLDEAWWQPSADIILSWLDIKDQARAA
jgi:pimeloyl-ACP methyl ester carboxylesterase